LKEPKQSIEEPIEAIEKQALEESIESIEK
jgi:hypothetical protein